ncbi:hypothetical protein K445DRAFT_27977 [Daldinia sp. EC12]|nr:hypothetical protein F4774DRAFT_424603 [Daldinia eschscholtzii]OTB10050.1 hypothetical protein K445DRAFT_27977 [Daldinia sp. EC12]
MCHKWSLKFMACGHIDDDNEILRCANYTPLYNNCSLREHGADTVREYTQGDGSCRKCLGREKLNEQYRRFQGIEPDQEARSRLDAMRTYLCSFESVEAQELFIVQDRLMREYIHTGVVLDVVPLLRELNCKLPELDVHTDFEDQSSWIGEIEPTPMPGYTPIFGQTEPSQWGEALQYGQVAPTPTWDIMSQSQDYRPSPPPPTPAQFSEENMSYDSGYVSASTVTLDQWASEMPYNYTEEVGSFPEAIYE